MTKLTALDIAAFRKADRLVVAYNPSNSSAIRSTCVRLVKVPPQSRAESDPFATDTVYDIDCPIRVHNIYASSAVPPTCCAFAMVWLFHSQHTSASSIVHTLRAGDEIGFTFVADGGTNGYIAAAGLHTDVLELHVWRGEGRNRKHFAFHIDEATAPGNLSRMVRGIPECDDYRRAGFETRRDNWTPPATIPEPADDA